MKCETDSPRGRCPRDAKAVILQPDYGSPDRPGGQVPVAPFAACGVHAAAAKRRRWGHPVEDLTSEHVESIRRRKRRDAEYKAAWEAERQAKAQRRAAIAAEHAAKVSALEYTRRRYDSVIGHDYSAQPVTEITTPTWVIEPADPDAWSSLNVITVTLRTEDGQPRCRIDGSSIPAPALPLLMEVLAEVRALM